MLTTPIREGAYYMTKAHGVVGPMEPLRAMEGWFGIAGGGFWRSGGLCVYRGNGAAWDLEYECDAQGNRIGDSWQITGGSPAIACVDEKTVLGTVTTPPCKGYVGIYRSKSTDKMLSTYVCDTRAAAETRYDERWSLITVLEFDLPEDAP